MSQPQIRVPTISQLQQRMMVLSTALQDFIEAMMQVQQENQRLKQELEVIKEELAKLRIEIKAKVPQVKTKSRKTSKSAQVQ